MIGSKPTLGVLYSASWPDETDFLPVEIQNIELHTYCLLQGLEVGEVVSDDGPLEGKGIRKGLRRVLDLAVQRKIGHIIVTDIKRLCRNSKQAIALLTEAFDPEWIEIHFLNWNLSTGDAMGKKLMQMITDIRILDQVHPEKAVLPLFENNALDLSKYKAHQSAEKKRKLYKEIFALLQDARYAGAILAVLFQAKQEMILSTQEQDALHSIYDNTLIQKALGTPLHVAPTVHARLVAGIITRFWEPLRDSIKTALGDRLQEVELSAYF